MRRSISRVIVRRRLLILVAMGATALTTVVLATITGDVYRSDVEILLRGSPVDELLQAPTAAIDDAALARRARNEVALIEGDAVYQWVLADLGFSSGPRAQASVQRGIDGITISVEARSPTMSAKMANAYATGYIEVRGARNAQLSATALEQLYTLSTDLEARITEIDEALAAADDPALIAEREVLERERDQLSANFTSLRMEMGLGLAPAEVVVAATAPEDPEHPGLLIELLQALLVGAAIGLAAAVAIDRAEGRIYHAEDLRQFADRAPVRAAVPVDPAADGCTPTRRGVDPSAEAYRMLRTQLLAIEPDVRKVGVVPVHLGCGATTTAASLSAVLAERDVEVLALDGALADPELHHRFGVDGSMGLIDCLAGEPIDLVLLPLDAHLSCLSVGLLPPDPAEVLLSSRLPLLLDELSSRFEWIVVDLPPLAGDEAAATLIDHVDGVISVVELGVTTSRQLRQHLDTLDALRIRSLGIVANKATFVPRPRRSVVGAGRV